MRCITADRWRHLRRSGSGSVRLDWIKPWTKLSQCSYDEADFGIEWFSDGTLNVSANCLDRHLEKNGETTAIIWEGDDSKHQRRLTYRQFHAELCRMPTCSRGWAREGPERITIFLPMIPEVAVAMLACTRIGQYTRSCSADFHPRRWRGASRIATAISSSLPTWAALWTGQGAKGRQLRDL